MMKIRLCDLLGIEYPIIQAGVPWVSNAELAAAVSAAGGLGTITPTAGLPLDGDVKANLRGQIRRARLLTDRPFGVTLSLMIPDVLELMDIAIEEGVRVIVTAAGSPALYTGYLKDKEVKVLHLVASVRHAKGAEAGGVDAVIAEGFESGGYLGVDEIPTFALVPQVVDAVHVPVLASGGVADGRGVAAALKLGAEGVHVGTRFIATTECIAHPRYKAAIISAVDSGTTVLGRASRMPVRALKTPVTLALREARDPQNPRAYWESVLSPERVRAAALEGDLERGIPLAGMGSGMLSDILPAAQVIQKMVEQAGLAQAKAR
ncbi:MAG: nitronate monooxygenase [Chloroflexi bacterium]|nr:nitronate monooxygenase [Chloroflexota bacterium]